MKGIGRRYGLREIQRRGGGPVGGSRCLVVQVVPLLVCFYVEGGGVGCVVVVLVKKTNDLVYDRMK